MHAADHFAGQGMEAGCELQILRKLLKAWGKSNLHQQVVAGLAIAAGDQWPQTRKQAQRMIDSPTCLRCQTALETLWHRYWACPANQSLQARQQWVDDARELEKYALAPEA